MPKVSFVSGHQKDSVGALFRGGQEPISIQDRAPAVERVLRPSARPNHVVRRNHVSRNCSAGTGASPGRCFSGSTCTGGDRAAALAKDKAGSRMPHQQSNNADHHQQFNECKPSPPSHASEPQVTLPQRDSPSELARSCQLYSLRSNRAKVTCCLRPSDQRHRGHCVPAEPALQSMAPRSVKLMV